MTILRRVRDSILRRWRPAGTHTVAVAVLLIFVGGLGAGRSTGLRTASTVAALQQSCGSVSLSPASSLPDTSLPAAFSTDEDARSYSAATSLPGRWVDLTALSWDQASTGWQRLADFDLPRVGQAFPYTPLQVNGQVFPTGIGTYPLSEITYQAGGQYGGLRAQVGLDDLSTPEARVTFSVYADDVLVYRTDPIAAGAAPVSLEAPLFGANQVRIVVQSEHQKATGAYADWLSPELYAPTGGAQALTQAHAVLVSAATARKQAGIRAASVGRPHNLHSITSDASILLATEGQSTVWFDPTQCLVALMNPSVEAAFGMGGSQHGQFYFGPANGDSPTISDGDSEILLDSGGPIALSQTSPAFDDPWRIAGISDPALGAGTQVTLNLKSPGNDPVQVLMTLYDGSSAVTYQVKALGALKPVGYSYFGGDASLSVGGDPRYLSDRGRTWSGNVPDDGIRRKVPLEPSKPLMVWSDATRQGFVMTTIDPSEAPMQAGLTRLPGDDQMGLSLAMGFLSVELDSEPQQPSPRLWIEPTSVDSVFGALADYRAMMNRVAPPAPLPDWVRYQWGSWWTYGPTPTDDGIRSQVDSISRNFGDLGAWHVLIDAAWYVAYGRPNASLKNVDPDKFPNGIRPVTDYAHSQGVNTVLYIPAGFLHSGLPEGGEWQAFQEIIDQDPDWLIPLFDNGELSAYMLNYSVPAVRDYLQSVVTDAIDTYGVDGIEIDGLADPEGQITNVRARDLHEISSPYLPSMEIYKLISDRLNALRPDTYLEGGWVNPMAARPYAHVFFLSDEDPSFSHPYPFGGLLEHIDYSLFQWVALGQRAKMANLRSDPSDPTTVQWIDAALATDAQVAIGFDLTNLTPAQVSALRSHLAHYDPFKGKTVTSSGVQPNAFATIRDHMAYLGVVNRTASARSFGDEIGQLQVVAPGLMAYDVERGQWISAMDVPDTALAPKSFRLFLIPEQPRVVWTNASWSYEPSDDSALVATLSGPAGMEGFAQIWAPDTKSVLVDGTPLARGASPSAGSYTLNPATGVVSLALTFDQAHRVEVRW